MTRAVSALLFSAAVVSAGPVPQQPGQKLALTDVATGPCNILLARPTADGMTLSALCAEDCSGQIFYGEKPDALALSTPLEKFRAGEPKDIAISGLRPSTRYYYSWRSDKMAGATNSFQTARATGSSFTFTITADSHLDEKTDGNLYERTLAAAASDWPDFHIDLGDTFMSEKHASLADAAKQYLAQRSYFEDIGKTSPLFLVLGNHDGETPSGRGGMSLAEWSHAQRVKFFPNPEPGGFYSGNTERREGAGLLQDYFSWEWGDALFVVLDPFWYSQKQRGGDDGWARTLGEKQYRWLEGVLARSHARYKFIFIHHLVGGLDRQSRGGSEAAAYYEWGGKNADGTRGWEARRPAWPAPIHELLAAHHAAVVFHGHDHLFAQQALDGVVYQEVPQPGSPGSGRAPRFADEYGYKSGVILGGPGYLRVRVAAGKATVDFVCTSGEKPRVAHSYEILPTAGR